MSIVTIQVGQCGNQVGKTLFEILANEFSHSENSVYFEQIFHRFFYKNLKNKAYARAILIDSEEKVVSSCFSLKYDWAYNDKLSLCQSTGAGNNWASGYTSWKAQSIEELLRISVELCDNFCGFLLLGSGAGGTGSGSGSKISEVICDEYPNAVFCHQIIWPHFSGEISVQQYNLILSLAHAVELSNEIIVGFNDVIRSICHLRLNIKNVNTHNLNDVLCHNVAGILIRSTNNYEFLPPDLTLHSGFKFLTMYSAPFQAEVCLPYANDRWEALIRRTRQMVLSGSAIDETIDWSLKPNDKNSQKSVGNFVVARGTDADTVKFNDFQVKDMYANWLPNCVNLFTEFSTKKFRGNDKSLFVLTNSQAIVNPLEMSLQKAWNMFSKRAYLHQYSKFSIEEDYFINSFLALEGVLENYKNIR